MEIEKIQITEEQYKTAEKRGISRSNVNNRVHFLIKPWSVERAISEPIKDRRGSFQRWLKLAHSRGISTEAFHSRRRSGWDLERSATQPVEGKKTVVIDSDTTRSGNTTCVDCGRVKETIIDSGSLQCVYCQNILFERLRKKYGGVDT